MTANSLAEQLTKYLTDLHSIEEQALAQMQLAPRLAGAAELQRIFVEHHNETGEHERLVRAQLDRRDAKPSTIKDVAGRAGGWGMILFARVNPDTRGTLAMPASAREHRALAASESVRRFPEQAAVEPVRAMADEI